MKALYITFALLLLELTALLLCNYLIVKQNSPYYVFALTECECLTLANAQQNLKSEELEKLFDDYFSETREKYSISVDGDKTVLSPEKVKAFKIFLSRLRISIYTSVYGDSYIGERYIVKDNSKEGFLLSTIRIGDSLVRRSYVDNAESNEYVTSELFDFLTDEIYKK